MRLSLSLIGWRGDLDFPTVIRLPGFTLDLFMHFSDRLRAGMSLYVTTQEFRLKAEA
jgi:hypothetical protein